MSNKLAQLWGWIDQRLPVQRAWDTHMGKYYAPKNFNFWYFFGVFSLVVLVNQLLTGIWLTMSYTPNAEGAFASVEYIMRDVDYGWLIRYMHSTGASAFFAVVYLHMFRGLLYGSYKAPRELVWIFGMTIYVALMAEAFMGYVLPWGQMSYWGAQVIVSLFGAIPYIGEDLVQWIRGDYLISGITLNRFFSLHVVALPIVILALVVLHILALHQVGSNNPDGIDIKKNKDANGNPKDGVPFHPFYTVHDLVGITVFLFVFCFIIFFMPEMGGYFLEYANFEEANNLKTPEHIAPVWYFTPFYAILRAVTIDLGGVFTAKFLGFVSMAAAIAILFVLPWIDKSPVRSIRYKGWMPKVMLLLFAAFFVILGYLGVKAPTPARTLLAQIGTIFYFVFFLTMPIFSNPDHSRVKSPYGWIVSFVIGILLITLSTQVLDTHDFMVFAGLGLGIFVIFLPLINLPLFKNGADKWALCLLLGYLIANLSLSMTDTEEQSFDIPLFLRLFGLALAALIIALPKLSANDTIKPEPERVQAKGLPASQVWLGLLFFVVIILAPIKAVGATGAFDCGGIRCDDFKADLSDKASLQRGAKWFVNYCMGCHSANFSRYERVATDLDIPSESMMTNLVFSQQRIGDLMTIPTSPEKSKNWFGAAPPDLTLSARSRSPEWLYTYLRNFYRDDSRATGVNNRVFNNVGMPHVMVELQGLLECDDDAHCNKLTEGSLKGSMQADEFDQAIYDLVNFMEYMAEPIALERQKIGLYVMLFLVVLLVVTALLNREYWKGIH